MIKRNILDCMILVGKTPSYYEGEKTYVSTGAVDCNHIDYERTEPVVYSKRPSRANLSVMSGDILFAKMCGTKKTLRINDVMAEYLFSTGFCAVRANEAVMTTDLLYHLLTSEQFLVQKDQNSSGATQKAITNAGLKKITLQVPDLKEQQVLTAELDCMEQLMEKRRTQIKYFDQLVKSRFMELFGNPITNDRGWDSANLPDVAEFVLGSTPKSSEPDYWDGDVKWITPAELDDNTFEIYDSVRHITEAGIKAAGLKAFPAGTVIFSTRAPIGKTAIAGCEMYCNQGFKNFICGELLNPVYLFSVLRINKDYFVGLGTGSTFKELSKARLEKISISIPPLALQNKFEAFYRQSDKSKHLYGLGVAA